MKPQGKLFYPKGVQPSKLILGDISYRREDLTKQNWDKYIYNGSSWLPYDAAPKNLIRKSELLRNNRNHIRLVVETGV